MYKVIGSVKSRTFRVLWMLEELGLSYEHQNVPPHAAEVLAYNPSGKVPILLDDGFAIHDSSAILTYLADKHGKLTAQPGTIERARQDALLHQILDEFDAVLWTVTRKSLGLKSRPDYQELSGVFKGEFKNNVARLFNQIGGPFLMGDRIVVPDIVLGHCGGWAYVAQFPNQSEKFNAYLKRLRSRPAYKMALAKAET